MGTHGLLHNCGDFSKDSAQEKSKMQWSCVLEAPYGSESQSLGKIVNDGWHWKEIRSIRLAQGIQFLIPSSAVATSFGRLNMKSNSGVVQNCHWTMPNTKSLMRLFLCFMGCRAVTYFPLWLRVGNDYFSALHHLSKIIKPKKILQRLDVEN